MLIQQKESGTRGMFYVEEKGELLAELVYNLNKPGRIVIEHTEVGDSLRGMNVGLQLVTKAVEYAQQEDLKIIPHCPYARSVISKRPEWQQLVVSS